MSLHIGPFSALLDSKQTWLRWRNRVVYVKDTQRVPKSFSERYGYANCLNVGRLLFGYKRDCFNG